MYQTILLPLDGSALSEQAVAYAASLASVAGARIVAVQAPVAEFADERDEQTGIVRTVSLAERYLSGVCATLHAGGVAAEAARVYGDPAAAILGAAAERVVDLIVMATHGRSGPSRWIFGSVADAVLRRSPAPVLLVPPSCALAWPGWPVGSDLSGEAPAASFRVLVPLDGSELALAALAPAVELAGAFGGELCLLRAAEPPHPPGRPIQESVLYDPAADLVDGRSYLERVAQTLGQRRVGVVCEAGAAAEVITAVAEDRQASAVAMATHGRSGLARLVLGSVATDALRRARRPFLLVRPAALRSHEPEADVAALAASR